MFRKTLIFFWKLQVWNAWRGVTTSVAFYCVLATFSDFGIIPKSFSENQFVFTKQSRTWTFWDILLFQSHSTSNLLLLELSRNVKNNFEKPIYFLWEKKQILNVLRKLTFFAAFYVKFANFGDFWKTQIFSQIRSSFFMKLKKKEFWTFWEFSLFR